MNPVIECAAWVAGIWLAVGIVAAWAKHRATKAARRAAAVATYRAWRTAQLEQPLDQLYPELDAQLDQYSHTIRSLYTTEEGR